MAANALVLLQLSLLLCSSITVYGDETFVSNPPAEAPHPPPHHHHHHHHPPAPSPSHPTPPPPSHPTPPPSPSHPTPPPSPTHPTPPPSPTHPVPPPPRHPSPPPSHAPTPPPIHPPVKPPSYPPPRKMVAVQGVVYCKACKFRGVDTLMGAAPLLGAVVKLQCNNTKYSLVEQTKTDKNGYFFFMPQKLTTSGSHKCKVFIVSSPLATCNVTTNFHAGIVGAILVPSTAKAPAPSPSAKPEKKLPFQLFTVGPFAFEPHKKLPCHY